METDARLRQTINEAADPRVAAVLEVLRGQDSGEVAQRWEVDPDLLNRWVSAFLDAGTAQVTNHPDEKAANQRDRFLEAFAHELRTPLGVAKGWASMLRGKAVPQPKVDHVVQRLCDALDQLADQTVDAEILAASSLGRLELKLELVRVGALARRLPGVTEIGGEGGEVELEVDPELFSRVLRDLWRAGASFPEPRSRDLQVVTVGPWVEISVIRAADPIDTGVLQALFEPFDVNDDGTGVTTGLYLARALTVAHGGAIGADQSERGAALWVRVPGRRSLLVQPPPPSTLSRGDVFKIACGDVMPGCLARFHSTDRQELLNRVAGHAASAHGITEITAPVQAFIEDKITCAAQSFKGQTNVD